MSVEIPFIVNGKRTATMGITRVVTGIDNIHTYDWEWGINNDDGYLQIDSGTIQHREADGLFALFHAILTRIRGRKE